METDKFSYRKIKSVNDVESILINKINKLDESKKVIFPNYIDNIPVTTIEIDYYWGEDIEEIVIPENIKRINGMPKVKMKIIISEKNENYTTDGNCLFDKNMKKLLRIHTREITEYTIPEGVEVISENAFAYCENLISITIPESVKIIETGAFLGCNKLKKVESGSQLIYVETGAFSSTPWYNKNDMVILGKTLVRCNIKSNETLILPDGLRAIADNALESNRFSYDNGDVTKKIVLPNTIESIGKSAFAYKKKLITIDLPNNLKTISESLFEGCESLEKILIPQNISVIEKSAFKSCKKLNSIKIPNSVEEIGDSAFEECKSLKKIELSSNLKIISNSLFSKCEELTEIIIPSTVEKISKEAFLSCEKLKELILPKNLKEIGNNAFKRCNLIKKLFIPENVEKIDNTAFPNFITIRIASTIIKNSFSKIEVDNNNKYFKSINGSLYSKDLKRLIYVPDNWEGEEFNICEETEIVESRAFEYNKTIRKIVFPDSIIKIGESACEYCEKLEEIVLPKNIKKIPKGLAKYCGKLKKIKWPENLEEIGEESFSGTNLKKLDFPSTVTTIDNHAFAYIKAKQITLPKNIKKIGLSILANVETIEVYDNIDDEAKSANEHIDDANGMPNSNVGWIGFCYNKSYMQCAAFPNSTWCNHTIVVKSHKTNEVKYKVHMFGIDEPRIVYCALASLWGRNAEFDFNRMDDYFDKMKVLYNKYKIAASRLEDNYNLNEETREKYESYLRKNGIKIIYDLIEKDDLDEIKRSQKYIVLNKNNIDKAISTAKEKKKEKIVSYLTEYKNEIGK